MAARVGILSAVAAPLYAPVDLYPTSPIQTFPRHSPRAPAHFVLGAVSPCECNYPPHRLKAHGRPKVTFNPTDTTSLVDAIQSVLSSLITITTTLRNPQLPSLPHPSFVRRDSSLSTKTSAITRRGPLRSLNPSRVSQLVRRESPHHTLLSSHLISPPST